MKTVEFNSSFFFKKKKTFVFWIPELLRWMGIAEKETHLD